MKLRTDKEILYSRMPNTVDWTNGCSDWIDLSHYWPFVQATWPGNGSALFNDDRGIGIDFLFEKKKLGEIPPGEQETILFRWKKFVRTLPASLFETLAEKDFRVTVVKFRLVGISNRRRHSISKKVKTQMQKTLPHFCVFCKTPGEPGRDLSHDHKDPRRAFTEGVLETDLQYACTACNNKKRTALKLHFDGTRILPPEKLAWFRDPYANP